MGVAWLIESYHALRKLRDVPTPSRNVSEGGSARQMQQVVACLCSCSPNNPS